MFFVSTFNKNEDSLKEGEGTCTEKGEVFLEGMDNFQTLFGQEFPTNVQLKK